MVRDAAGPDATEATSGDDAWRLMGGDVCAWFSATSTIQGAALVRRVAALTSGDTLPDLDLRANGLRVRIDATGSSRSTEDIATLTRAISEAARDLGLTADPAILQVVRLVIGTADLPAVSEFWRSVVGYEPAGDTGLRDASRRDPAISFRPLSAPRPFRNRIHVDVVRAAETVETVKTAAGLQAYGAYGLTLSDADGNEVDLVPGDQLTEGTETDDWSVLFGAMAFYPVPSVPAAVDLASAVAVLADEADLPVLIDLRPGGVTVDSGKDQWEDDDRPDKAFAAFAAQVQTVARNQGLVADPTPLRFVQLAYDAVDIPAVQGFWRSLLGYQPDPRTHLTDVYDPRRLNPVIMFQDLDASEAGRLAQRDRIHVELLLPSDQVPSRIATALSAGGTLVDEDADRRTLVDPEGNEVEIIWTERPR